MLESYHSEEGRAYDRWTIIIMKSYGIYWRAIVCERFIFNIYVKGWSSMFSGSKRGGFRTKNQFT